MTNTLKACDLCGLTVDISGFTLKTKEGLSKSFCCVGCKSIFQLLNEDQFIEPSEQEVELNPEVKS